MSAKLEEMLRIAEAATQGPTAMPGEQRVIDDEIYVTMLLAYQQADMDGTMVLASRQAIHETVDALRATKGQLRDALAEVAMMTRMLTDPPAGHGETCPACNEKIDGATGNASKWPMLFAPLKGVSPTWHHRGCVHNLHWTAESALSATKAKLEVVTSALRQHHKRRLDAGEMAIAKDDKGEWIALDMSAEYGDSTLCDTTLAALTPSTTKEP